MAKLRQTLIPFTSNLALDKVAKPTDSSEHRHLTPPHQPLHLPKEVWDPILDRLGTYALKKFRLVCLEWSRLGTERLYSTVYLSPYESSWSGLVSISTSPYAPLVKRIVWSPLELPEECLDGPLWASRYQNLLRGLKHAEIIRLHQAFVRVYRDRSSLRRSTTIESILGAIGNLPNCHEIVLSDDYDLPTSHNDSCLRVAIHSDPDMLEKPNTWALRPRMWDETNDGCGSMLAVEDMLQVLRGCPSLTSLRINLWSVHWVEVHKLLDPRYVHQPSSGRWKRVGIPYPGIRELQFSLRFCELRWIRKEEFGIQDCLAYAVACTDLFPCLEELSFAPSFADPGPGYVESFRRPWEGLEDDDPALKPLFRPGITASQLVAERAAEAGLTATMFNCVYAELWTVTTPRLPNLRTLRLSNATVDMEALVDWLAGHGGRVSLHLQDTIILHGRYPRGFLKNLAQLNVRLSYDSHGPSHRPLIPPLDREDNETPHHNCYLADFDRMTAVQRGLNYIPSSDTVGSMFEPFSITSQQG